MGTLEHRCNYAISGIIGIFFHFCPSDYVMKTGLGGSAMKCSSILWLMPDINVPQTSCPHVELSISLKIEGIKEKPF